MTRLYEQLRIHQIFGANTAVGKTIFSTALCRASSLRKSGVFYLKPVSTGAPEEADDLHIKTFCKDILRDTLKTRCLFQYTKPLSPHLAAQLDNKEIISDEWLSKLINDHISKCANGLNGPSVMYIETAGGVNSPAISGSPQADAYRSLLLPVILIGDSRLGGISATISAYESLLLRGYQIDAVSMFSHDFHKNHLYLSKYFGDREIPLFNIQPPPNLTGDSRKDIDATNNYYSTLRISPGSQMELLEERLHQAHLERLKNLDSMAERTMHHVWWPFVQHGMVKDASDVTVIDSAQGDFFSVYKQSHTKDLSLLNPEFDGSASWWTQTIGHSNAALTMAAAQAAGRYGHVMFPQATHLPALKLAEALIQGPPGKGWASRAFFSDNGSTGMEVALKMAFRAFTKRRGWKKHVDPELGVLGLKGSYHGDTIGAMDACEEGIYSCEWHNAKGFWLDPPTIGVRRGTVKVNLPQPFREFLQAPSHILGPLSDNSLTEIYDVESRLRSPLADIYRNFIQNALENLNKRHKTKLAALVLEPLVMGAGGMVFVDPLFQRILVECVRSQEAHEHSDNAWKGLPIIFDEVFVGLRRLGFETCSSVLGVSPDIGVYAKMLTGGLIPMAITLASDSVYQAFMGDTKAKALLHGHSYTAHPIGCQVALETLRQVDIVSQKEPYLFAQRQWKQNPLSSTAQNSSWSFWSPEFVKQLSLRSNVEEVMALGTVLAFKIRGDMEGYISGSAHSALSFLKHASINSENVGSFNVHYRTLGDVAYLMCSLNTRPETLRSLEDTLLSNL